MREGGGGLVALRLVAEDWWWKYYNWWLRACGVRTGGGGLVVLGLVVELLLLGRQILGGGHFTGEDEDMLAGAIRARAEDRVITQGPSLALA